MNLCSNQLSLHKFFFIVVSCFIEFWKKINIEMWQTYKTLLSIILMTFASDERSYIETLLMNYLGIEVTKNRSCFVSTNFFFTWIELFFCFRPHFHIFLFHVYFSHYIEKILGSEFMWHLSIIMVYKKLELTVGACLGDYWCSSYCSKILQNFIFLFINLSFIYVS